MKKEEINLPGTLGPYSPGIKFGNLLFVSGQIGFDPKTNLLGSDIETQTKQALLNLKKVLEKGGSSLKNVLKTTIYLKNLSDFSKVNKIYADFFSKPYPARATIGVAELPKGALIEIEALAFCEK